MTSPTDQATRCRELLQKIVDGPKFTTDLSVVCRLASALALATSVAETLIARDMRAVSDEAERGGQLNNYLRLRGGME